MSVDPSKYYVVTEIPAILPRPVTRQTIWRWMIRGSRGRKLPSIRQAGQRLIKGQWLIDFLDIQEPEQSPREMTPRQADRATRKASEELARAGW